MKHDAHGWHAGLVELPHLRRTFALYLGRERDRNTWESATVGEDGNLVLNAVDMGTESQPLLYLPWGADVALAEAFEGRSPDAEWKARAEERQVALEREVARVDRFLGAP